jgi:hypothetical protein
MPSHLKIYEIRQELRDCTPLQIWSDDTSDGRMDEWAGKKRERLALCHARCLAYTMALCRFCIRGQVLPTHGFLSDILITS